MADSLYPHESPIFWILIGFMLPIFTLGIGIFSLDIGLLSITPIMTIAGLLIVMIAGAFIEPISKQHSTVCPHCNRRIP